MALNFPSNTSLPYYDNVSGLKYIFNTSIGAWETAIQPPAVIGDTGPEINIPGFLWWDSDSGILKIWYVSNGVGAWVDSVPGASSTPQTAATSRTAPSNPNIGDLWWCNDDTTGGGRLYVYYNDGDSKQWVDASPIPTTKESGIEQTISQGVNPHANAEANDLWYDSDAGQLFIYYEDADSSQWVTTTTIPDYTGVQTIAAGSGLTVGGTAKNPTLSLSTASLSASGITRHATVAESNAGTATDVVLTPSVLKSTISSYVSDTTSYATTAETTTGTATNKAVTPAALAAALPSLGTANPVGTVLEFANQNPPTGYLKCDGSAVNRTTYSALFAVIGTNFGIGDGGTTFNLPTLTHSNSSLIYCIKH